MNARLKNALWVIAMSLYLCGCDRMVNQTGGKMGYNLAVNSAISGNGYAGEFNRVFPDSKNTISYYDGTVGPTRWTSSIGLYGRYVLCVTFPITLDFERTNVVSEGVPEFYLYELPKITDQGGGSYYLEINQFPRETFTLETWKRLVLANGIFADVGIVLETNKPIANFASAWRTFR
jgi:hypothetical protein